MKFLGSFVTCGLVLIVFGKRVFGGPTQLPSTPETNASDCSNATTAQSEGSAAPERDDGFQEEETVELDDYFYYSDYLEVPETAIPRPILEEPQAPFHSTTETPPTTPEENATDYMEISSSQIDLSISGEGDEDFQREKSLQGADDVLYLDDLGVLEASDSNVMLEKSRVSFQDPPEIPSPPEGDTPDSSSVQVDLSVPGEGDEDFEKEKSLQGADDLPYLDGLGLLQGTDSNPDPKKSEYRDEIVPTQPPSFYDYYEMIEDVKYQFPVDNEECSLSPGNPVVWFNEMGVRCRCCSQSLTVACGRRCLTTILG